MRTLVDTDVLVALRDPTHPRHDEALEVLSVGPIVVTRGSLAEFTTVIRRLAKNAKLPGNVEARKALAALLAHPAYRSAGPVEDVDIVALCNRDARLSLVDAWNIVASRKEREPLVSFDKPVRRYAKA